MSALLDVTVTGSFVLIAALGATRLLSGRSAALRHCVIAAALACAAALPLLRLVVPTWHVDLGIAAAFGGSRPTTAVQPREATTQRPASDVGRVAMIVPQRFEPDAARRNVPAEGVMFGWLMGVMVSSGILLVGVARLRWLASRATELGEGTWVAVARELARHYSLRRTPLVLQSDHPALLVTVGRAAAASYRAGGRLRLEYRPHSPRPWARAGARAAPGLAHSTGRGSSAVRLLVQPDRVDRLPRSAAGQRAGLR